MKPEELIKVIIQKEREIIGLNQMLVKSIKTELVELFSFRTSTDFENAKEQIEMIFQKKGFSDYKEEPAYQELVEWINKKNKILFMKKFKTPIELLFRCDVCKNDFKITVEAEDYDSFLNNEASVQECFPYLSADERELMISGMCGACFDNLMKK